MVTAQEAFRELVKDDAKYIAAFFKIPDKEQQVVPMIPRPSQLKILDAIKRWRRVVIVKAAQVGSTSICTASLLKAAMTVPHTTSVIVAHNDFLTQRLLHRAQVMYDSVHPKLRPRQDHKSAHEKRFPGINSVMYIGTAKAQTFGRGEPIHHLLLSEAAFYEPGARDRIVAPALERVPTTGTVIIESTPNGEDEVLYQEVQKAIRGESLFHLIVIYWWDEPSNVLTADTQLNIPEDWRLSPLKLTAEEHKLVDQHKLSDDQIRWRRMKLRSMGQLFFQEHMENIEQAFMRVENPFYDTIELNRLASICHAGQGGMQGAEIWEEPKAGNIYVVGVDPGLGKHSESVASMWRWTEAGPVNVATLGGWYDTAEMARRVNEFGRYYFNALLIGEANAHGQGFLSDLNQTLHYPNLWRRQDPISGRDRTSLGWITSASTKPYMMNLLQAQLPRLTTWDEQLVNQIRGFKIDKATGKIVPGRADDRHDAACLAMVGLNTIRPAGARGFRFAYGFKW